MRHAKTGPPKINVMTSAMIRIGTWNVEYAKQTRLTAFSKCLRHHRADIWVLTETHDDLVPSQAE